MDKANLQTIRESFGRVVYSHKTHEKEVEIQNCYATLVKWVNILLVSITSGTLLVNLITSQSCYLVVSSVFAFLSLGFSIFQLSFNPEKKAAQHKHAASLLWPIREKYIYLITDIVAGRVSDTEIVARRDALMCELDVVYKTAPSTTSKAYRKAGDALKVEDELTFSDKEINQFLPKELWLK